MSGAAADIDVVVVGGGVVGSCVAGFLAEAGRGVMIIDDGRIGGSNANAGSLHVQMQSRFMQLYPQNVPGMERQLPRLRAALPPGYSPVIFHTR